jgi:hypothetical protein
MSVFNSSAGLLKEKKIGVGSVRKSSRMKDEL